MDDERRKNFEWFDLKNYDNINSFSATDWEQSIRDRRMNRDLLIFPESEFSFSPEIYKKRRNEALEYWCAVRENGTKKRISEIDLADGEEVASVSKDYSSIGDVNEFQVGVIRNLTYRDLMDDIFDDVSFDEMLDDYNQFGIQFMSFTNNEDARRALCLNYNKKYQKSFGCEFRGYVSVELWASDEQIKDNFSKWLAMQRGENESRRATRITNKDFDGWVEAKILQYFDLKNISEFMGLRISNHLIGDLLFPDDINVEVGERIRKVTKPKADKVFSRETVLILSTQNNHV